MPIPRTGSERYVWVASDYTVESGKPIVYIFARNEQAQRVIFKVHCRPYFYAPLKEAMPVQSNEVEISPETYTGIDGNILKKVFVRLPRDVPIWAAKFSKAYEDKLAFPLRFLIDRGIRSAFCVKDGTLYPIEEDIPAIKPKVMYFDIENETEKGATIDPIEAKFMVLMIGFSFSDSKEFRVLTAKNEEEEKQMYYDLINVLREEQPDIITGWNIFYDLATIYGRMQKLGVDPHKLSPMGFAEIKDRYNRMKINGLNIVDAMVLFKKFFQGKTYDSYKLSYLAEKILKVPDDHFDYEREMNRNYIEKIIAYNKRDVMDRLRGIVEHFHLIELYDGLRRVAGCRFEDVIFTSMYTDVSQLREYNGKYILGTRGKDEPSEDEYEGGFVGQAPKGIFSNVVTEDFAAMYPNIIIGYNMSPETMVRKEDVQTPENYHKFDFENGDIIYFKKSPIGIIPLTVMKFMNYRQSIKKQKNALSKDDPLYEILDLSEYGIKQAIAAIYGTFAFRGSRLHYPDIARCITYAGRLLVTQCKKLIEDAKYTFLYADTDSLYIQVVGDPVIEGEKIESMINAFLEDKAKKEGSTKSPKIEFEQAYEAIAFKGVKKRYAGICIFWKGKPTRQMIIKGFEAKRSDSALISRETQTKVLEMLLTKRPEKEIRDYLKPIIEQIKNMPFSEVGIPKRIRKPLEEYPPGMVRGMLFAVKYMNKMYVPGDRPLMFYITRMKDGLPSRVPVERVDKKGRTSTEMVEIKWVPLDTEAELNDWRPLIDWETQTEKIIENKLDDILDMADISISEITTGQKQMKLEGFN